MDKLNFMKINNFYISKNIVEEVKMQPLKWEKYLQIMSDKGLIFRMYEELLQIHNSKNPTTQLKKDKRLAGRGGSGSHL